MTEKQKVSVIYHSIFNFYLSDQELVRWAAGQKLKLKKGTIVRTPKNKKTSNRPDSINIRKLKIANNASRLLSHIPTVLFIGITGSLAMNNAKDKSDIDLMVITKKDSLWLTRIVVYVFLKVFGINTRKPGDLSEKDKVCLNFWMDESALLWSGPKDAYIAHEVSQVIPLVNKEKIHQRWLWNNTWVKEYWPNATNIKIERLNKAKRGNTLIKVINVMCFKLQYHYMKKRITREVIQKNIALFHPYDWGEKVKKDLKKKGVIEV